MATYYWPNPTTLTFPASGGGGGGSVDSVNGQTGVVILDADDVGAASQALDNLASTAVNADILPDGDNTRNFGDATHRWQTISTGNVDAGTGGLILSATANVSVNAATLAISAAPTIIGDGANSRALSFTDKDNSFVIAVKAPDTLTENTLYTLPLEDGTTGQVLSTDGVGVMSWETPSSTPSLANDQWLTGRNAADDGDINIARVSALDHVTIGDGTTQTFLGNIRNNGTLIQVAPASDFIFLDASDTADLGEIDIQSQEVWLFPATDSVASTSLKFFDPTVSNFVALKADNVQATDITLTLPTILGSPGDVLTDVAGDGVLSFQPATGGGATTALDNLASTAVNADIIPDTDNTLNLGSAALRWASLYTVELKDASDISVLSVPGRTLNDVAGATAVDFSSATQVILTKPIALYNSASDPGSASAGWIYFNTGSNKIKVFNGTTWETVTSI